MHIGIRRYLFLAGVAVTALTPVAPQKGEATDERSFSSSELTIASISTDVKRPSYGIGYDRYEPMFYTGFAPRIQEPDRIHLHLGRGNQLRITTVLSHRVLQSYAADLLARYHTYQSLIGNAEIVLTQNRAFESFDASVREIGLEQLVADEGQLSDQKVRERNLKLMERLNPDRVFRIRMPIDEVIRRWIAQVGDDDRRGMRAHRQIELVNQMLPTRLFVRELDQESSAALKALVSQVEPEDQRTSSGSIDRIRTDFVRLFDNVTRGHYPLHAGVLDFVEFTAIHPVGSFNDYTEHRGRRIPMFPTPGRRALTTHQRSKTVDHIPTKVSYSYSP